MMRTLQEKLCGRGSAPHGDWLEQPPVGGSKLDCLKQGASALLSSRFSFSSISNSCKDDPEAGPLDSRLNIGWDKLSRRIQDFVKAVTSQNQHQTAPCSNTASPVTSHNSDSSQRRFPEQHVGTEQRIEQHVETHVETRQRPSLLN